MKAVNYLGHELGAGGGGAGSVTSQHVSQISAAVDVVSNALSQETSVARAAEASLSVLISGLVGGGGSVTSTELSQHASVNLAAEASLSAAIDVVSNALSQEASVARAAETSLSALVNVVSNALSQEASVARAAEGSLSARATSIVTSATMGNILLQSILDLKEIAAPATPPADTLRLYAIDRHAETVPVVTLPDGNTFHLIRDNAIICKNTSGGPIAIGEAVYISGAVGASGTPTVSKAKADSAATMPAIGLVLDAMADNDFGHVVTLGDCGPFDTSGFAAGAVLYVSSATAGALTTSPPAYPNLTQRVGVVVDSSLTGQVFVYPYGLDVLDQFSNELSVARAAEASLSTIHNVVSNALSQETSAARAAETSLSNKISEEASVARGAEASLSVLIAGVAGGSVTSTELSQHASVNLAAEASLSTLVNVVSNAISQETSVARAAEASLSVLIAGVGGGSVTSTELSQHASVNLAAEASLSAAIVSLSATVDVVSNALSQETSVARAAEASLSAAAVSLSALVNVVSNALSQETSVARAAEASLSAAINAVSNALSQEASVARAAEASLSNKISAVSVSVTAVSNALSQETSVARAAEASLSAAINTISNTLSDLLSQHNTMSNTLSALSNYASMTSQYASQVSAYASQVSQRASQVSAYASVVSMQTQGLQSRVLGADFGASVASNIASLNMSVAATGIYKIEWNLMISHAASLIVSVALSGPTLTNMAALGRAAASVGTAAGASVNQGALNAYGTICQLTMNAAGVKPCFVEGIFVVGGGAGNIVISVGVPTGSLIGVKTGSLVRAWKVG